MIKEPIYYCTNFRCEQEAYPSSDPEDYVGEYIENYYIESRNIRNDEGHTVSYESHVPYAIESLPDADKYVNVNDYGDSCEKVEGPSYEDYKRAYAELLEMGKTEESITASTLREYLKDFKVEDTKGKEF